MCILAISVAIFVVNHKDIKYKDIETCYLVQETKIYQLY